MFFFGFFFSKKALDNNTMVSLSLSKSEEEGVFFPLFFYYFTNFMVLSIVTRDKNDKNDKNEIKKQVIYLYVCYPPGLEDYSSRPGIVS